MSFTDENEWAQSDRFAGHAAMTGPLKTECLANMATEDIADEFGIPDVPVYGKLKRKEPPMDKSRLTRIRISGERAGEFRDGTGKKMTGQDLRIELIDRDGNPVLNRAGERIILPCIGMTMYCEGRGYKVTADLHCEVSEVDVTLPRDQVELQVDGPELHADDGSFDPLGACTIYAGVKGKASALCTMCGRSRAAHERGRL